MAGTDDRCPHHLALLDPHQRIRRFVRDGVPVVGKCCRTPAGRRELGHAAEARKRLHGLALPVPFPVRVVVPEITKVGEGWCLLISPDLGEPLAMQRDLAGDLLPRPRLLALLTALLNVGVEAPGFVPRNLFHRDGCLHIIDWEDADITASPAVPDDLTVMKWDVAWSDVYETDPGIRHAIEARRSDVPSLDSFERALAELMGADPAPAHTRARGIDMTLRSELYVPGTVGVSAAELGHLADELLPARHSVLHTALAARVRAAGGDHAYARLVTSVWTAVQNQILTGADTAEPGAEAPGLVSTWLRALCTAADRCIVSRQTGEPLAEIHQQLTDLNTQGGWLAACQRAELAESLLAVICDLITCALDLTGLQLLLRGSLAQGILTRHSDLDFELSGPQHPCGHRGAERLVMDVLAAFDLQAEASEGRPTEVDLYDLRSRLGRDLHEWMELRRSGSIHRDPGWLTQVFDPTVPQLVDARSEYEGAGRRLSPKYLWFEARALVARLACRHASDIPPATIPQQLELLRDVLGSARADEVRQLVRAALALREQNAPELTSLRALQDRIDRVRVGAGLPGPAS